MGKERETHTKVTAFAPAHATRLGNAIGRKPKWGRGGKLTRLPAHRARVRVTCGPGFSPFPQDDPSSGQDHFAPATRRNPAKARTGQGNGKGQGQDKSGTSQVRDQAGKTQAGAKRKTHVSGPPRSRLRVAGANFRRGQSRYQSRPSRPSSIPAIPMSIHPLDPAWQACPSFADPTPHSARLEAYSLPHRSLITFQSKVLTREI